MTTKQEKGASNPINKSMLYTALIRASSAAVIVASMITVNYASLRSNTSVKRTLGIVYFEEAA
jgi:hypothetical protein